ncbi:MAG: methionine ABC transporter ATP-binding protein [Alphaproteobacteria bacterium BRH_c36]|nr:MAG: methionine ABC transporter ATP-binding protein [Alphaproteobacteria bacterium BRH_c36]
MSAVRFTWPGQPRFRLSIDRFEVVKGERVLLLGPSGGGKSTLLSLLAGIVSPQTGQVDVLGTNIAKLPGAARDRFRAEHFGIIFQMFNLLPYGTVTDNVLLPLSFSQQRRANVAANGTAADEAARLLLRLGLPGDEIACHRASSLSVGQQQRVAAARALIGRPEIIVADEPTSSLDRAWQKEFLDLLFEEIEVAGATLIMVSHDETLAELFTRCVRLDDIATIGRGAP